MARYPSLLAAALVTPLIAADPAPEPAAAAKASDPPAGFHSVTPNLAVHDARAAIAFYAKAFDAKQRMLVPGDDGVIVHAEISIGDAIVMLADENPGDATAEPKAGAPCSASIHLYVRDCDAVFKQAVAAGAKALMPPTDVPWGQRFAMVADPFNHVWSIATPKPEALQPAFAPPADAAPAGGPQF